MSWREYYGFSRTSGSGAAGGYQKSKREFNNTHTAAQKEKIYRQRQNIFSYVRNMFSNNKKNNETDVPVSEIENFSAAGAFGGVIDTYNRYVYAAEANKEGKIQIYREMAKYPEISFAIDEYVNEAINPNKEGKIMELIIKSNSIRENDNLRKTLEAEWDHLVYDIMRADENGSIWFRDFIIDAEFALEKVIDNENPQKGIVRTKKLRTTKLHPIWDDLEADDVAQFVYKTETQALAMDPEMVAYCNSGDVVYNVTEDDKVVLGLLEPAKTTYKRLKQLEDAVVIYRLVRAPERRVFKIDVGQLPKGRAEQYIKETMQKYRQRKFFDPKSGDVSESLDVMAMTEDFWFPVFNGGRASTVDTLQGGENLGQIDDVVFFLNKLYRSLKVPISRFESDTGFSIGDTSDITREEVKFVKQVRAYSSRFANIFKSVFLSHLRLKGIVEQHGIREEDIYVRMFSNNLFDQFMEAKIQEMKFNKFANVADMVGGDQPLIAKEFAFKKYLEMSDDDYEKNEELLASEKAAKELEGGNDGSGDDIETLDEPPAE